MGQTIFVEADTGDRPHLTYSNGLWGGKAILAILIMGNAYCTGINTEADVDDWFSSIELQMRGSISVLILPMFAALTDWQDRPLQDDSAKTKWADASTLLTHINHFISTLLFSRPASMHWYTPEDSLLDFECLAQTITLLIARGARQVRFLVH